MSDRRQAHRFPSTPERSEAQLKVGDDTVRARLLDESAVGFALQVDQHPGVYEGEVVWLLVGGCWTKARVARIKPAETGIELGLSRLTEPRQTEAPLPKKGPRFWRMPQSNRATVVIALSALMTLSTVPLLKGWQRDSQESAQAAANEAADVDRWLRDTGPSVFVTVEVMSVLRLSPQQLKYVKAIAARNEHALELAKATGASVEELRRMKSDALLQAREVLSPEQQAKWEELVRLLHVQQQ